MTADDLLERLGPGEIAFEHTHMLPSAALMIHPAKPGTLVCGHEAYSKMLRARAAVDALVRRVSR